MSRFRADVSTLHAGSKVVFNDRYEFILLSEFQRGLQNVALAWRWWIHDRWHAIS